MAIIGITPTFMSPIAYRNFAPELEQQTRSNAAGLRQLADFATKAYDYNKNRQIGDALKRGNVDEAAELESQKINQQDPAVLWRWKEGQNLQKAQIDAANAQRAADEQKAKQNIMNETESLLNNVVTDNPEAMVQYINNLHTQREKLKNMNLDTTPVDKKIKQMTDALEGRKAAIAEQEANTKAQAATKQTHDSTVTDIKEQISAGAIESAVSMIDAASKSNIINPDEVARFNALIEAKEREMAAQTRNDITGRQNYGDAQGQRKRRSKWK